MRAAVTKKAVVEAEGRIEVSDPDLHAGEQVEIIILLPSRRKRGRSAAEIIASAPGGRMFKTAEEVDAYIAGERESWGD